MRVSVAEDESDSGEEVALPRAIASNDHIVLWREGLNNGLLFIAMLLLAYEKYDANGARWYLLKPCMIICLMYILSDCLGTVP